MAASSNERVGEDTTEARAIARGNDRHGSGMVGTRSARLECDLVMKGGITSGVVYPAAVAELHKTYAFRSIGGASAGAIAAAATAAAEYGEESGGGGFSALEAISQELTKDRMLEKLFAPTKAAEPAFRLLLRLQRQQSTAGKAVVAVAGLAMRLWGSVAAAALLAVLLLFALVNQFHPAGRPAVLGWVLLATLVLLFAALGLVVGVVMRARALITRHLPQSYFGMCTGMPTDAKNRDPAAGLTPWLHAKLQHLSGATSPLTFRHLVEGGGTAGEITLTLMTTDVSRARPVQLPDGASDYCFRPDDFRRLFPEDVVEAMIRTSRVLADGGEPTELRRLDDPRDLPVLVATRMSLSFPVLLSAVPLYTHTDGVVRRHWMSDGGISSNFPVHLFDSWLPRRPTLALSFLPTEMAADRPTASPCEKSPQVPPHGSTHSLFGFLSQILDTMQNWRDTLQSELPGFNDRVEVVALEEHEGGMNLTMPDTVIRGLVEKGEQAGRSLRTFPDQWERHRFHRFHMTMRLLQQELGPEGSFCTGSADELLDQLLAGAELGDCSCRDELSPGWEATAAAQTKALRELVARWAAPQPKPARPPPRTVSFADGRDPAPPSVMRRTPRV